MKKTLENLWNEYLLEECAAMHTSEEQRLAKKAADLHEKVTALLSKEQEEAVEKFVDTLGESEMLFVKKAFFKGCEFAVSFLLETGNFGK